MLLPQGTILPNFYFFSIFLQKLCCLKRLFIMQRGVGAAPPSPRCYFFRFVLPQLLTQNQYKKSAPLPDGRGALIKEKEEMRKD